MFCPSCGGASQEHERFCAFCGTQVRGIAPKSAIGLETTALPQRKRRRVWVIILVAIFVFPVLRGIAYLPFGLYALAQKHAKLAAMSESELLNAAGEIVASGDYKKVTLAEQEQASEYLAEFEKRHQQGIDEHERALKTAVGKISSDRKRYETLTNMNAHPPAVEAWISCSNAVRSNLKVPSTADFVDRAGDNTFYKGDGQFNVQMRVDAQNSFGAKLRSVFICKVLCTDSDIDHCFVISMD